MTATLFLLLDLIVHIGKTLYKKYLITRQLLQTGPCACWLKHLVQSVGVITIFELCINFASILLTM